MPRVCPATAPRVIGVKGGRDVVTPRSEIPAPRIPAMTARRVDVGGLALVGAHAGGGVALEVFDREVAFAGGEMNVSNGDVVLKVEEVPAIALGRAPRGHAEERTEGVVAFARCVGRGGQTVSETGLECGLSAGLRPLGEAVSEAVGAVARARGGRTFCGQCSGRKQAFASFQEMVPRAWLHRCRDGLQPAELKTESQESRRDGRKTAEPSLSRRATVQFLSVLPAGRADDRTAGMNRDALLPVPPRRAADCARSASRRYERRLQPPLVSKAVW